MRRTAYLNLSARSSRSKGPFLEVKKVPLFMHSEELAWPVEFTLPPKIVAVENVFLTNVRTGYPTLDPTSAALSRSGIAFSQKCHDSKTKNDETADVVYSSC
jgi:hypothetical protein